MISFAQDLAGLIRYLYGPGRAALPSPERYGQGNARG
jgi:hypothetical protein